MTREEAIKELTELLPEEFLSEYTDAIKMGIEALKQQSCEDCVSRNAVLDLVADYDLSMGQVVKSIHALPPVTPQIKIENAPLSTIKSIREKEDNDGHN